MFPRWQYQVTMEFFSVFSDGISWLGRGKKTNMDSVVATNN